MSFNNAFKNVDCVSFDPNGKPIVDVNKLVKKFLKEYPVVRYNHSFYSYVAEKGIWKKEDSIDDIRRSFAKYMEDKVGIKWGNRYKEEANENIRIFTKSVEQMNNSDIMICTKNAVINVESGKAYPLKNAKKYYFTTSIPVVYDPAAKCPLFREFLRQISCGDKNRMVTLIEFLGLILTQKINDVALVCVGNGANGKSVYANICCALLGEDNFTSIVLSDLTSFGTGKLPGKRLAVLSEISPKDSKYLMTTEMKQIVTGELMSCNEKYKPIRDFRPFAKVLVLTNHMIGLTQDSSDGVTRRFLIVPFEFNISKKNRDINLEEKLKTEISGILNLAIKGYKRLKKNNFIYASQTESDRLIQDIIVQDNPFCGFVNDRIYFAPEARVLYKDLNKAYMAWKGENDIMIDENATGAFFRRMLMPYGSFKRWRSDGKRGLQGVGLKK